MYEGFAYISQHGVVGRKDYKDFMRYKSSCDITDHELQRHALLRNIGYREHDGRTNDDYRIML